MALREVAARDVGERELGLDFDIRGIGFFAPSSRFRRTPADPHRGRHDRAAEPAGLRRPRHRQRLDHIWAHEPGRRRARELGHHHRRCHGCHSRRALVDVEVYDAQGRVVAQRFWDGSRSPPIRACATGPWVVPSAQLGTYTVKVGVFGEGWNGLLHWNDRATTVHVSAGRGDPDDHDVTADDRPAPPRPRRDRRPRRRPPRPRHDTRHRRPARHRQRRLRRAAALRDAAVGAAAAGRRRVRRSCPRAPEIRPANAGYNQTTGGRHPDATGLYTARDGQLHRHDRRDHPVGGLQVGLRRGRGPRPGGQGVVVVPAQPR